MLHIEYVCTGNNGRSPMAEAIAQDYVHERGLVSRVAISSSGSGLHQSTRKNGVEEVRQEQLTFVELALKNGIFQRDWQKYQAQLQTEARLDADPVKLKELFEYVVRVEGILRDRALWDISLVAAGEYHKPMVARPNRPGVQSLILAMAQSNLDQVSRIYTNFGPNFKTNAGTINGYAQMDGDVPNPFCQLLPAYEQCRDHLLVAVPKTIDRAVRELCG
ncbi:hypothetical protein J4444_04240 [Candidatus Woesearchaeota archaeon]|nr:hypothetical protein [Candidatus Woesearchaeota archaeon]